MQAGVVFGFDHDDRSIFRTTVEFFRSAGLDSATVSVLIPFPNTPLFQRLDAEGRILTRDWSKYNGKKDVVFQPALMSPRELLMGMEWAARQFYSLGSIVERMARSRTGLWWNLARNVGYHLACEILRTWASIRNAFREDMRRPAGTGDDPCGDEQQWRNPGAARSSLYERRRVENNPWRSEKRRSRPPLQAASSRNRISRAGWRWQKNSGWKFCAARRVNTNLVAFRPKPEPAKVSFVKHQRQWHENHQPDKHHHQARMAIQEMAFHKDADRLKEEVNHHRAEENSARDTVKRDVDHAFVQDAGCRKDQEQREHGATA